MRYYLYARKSSESEDRQVMSIKSQVSELKKMAEDRDLKIIKVFKEEQSAKAPGRPIFNEMITKLQEGKADGIICWKLNRLARNPIDGGQIIWMSQQNIIKHIVSYDREYRPTDNVIMMNVEFGMANQFILDLRKDTLRGINNKLKMGWFPGIAPVGYKNDRINPQGEKKIFVDKKRFPIVRKLWDLLLTGIYSVDSLAGKAKELGLTNRHTHLPLFKSKVYDMFNNVFYAGKFKYAGEVYQGKHQPMITEEQFERAQEIIRDRSKPRKQTHDFAYTGLIRCGECGAMITAEEKDKFQKNGNHHHYTYYRCTKRQKKCSQKFVRLESLEENIDKYLAKITISEKFKNWALDYLRRENQEEVGIQNQVLKNHQRALRQNQKKINNLLDLRLNELIDNTTFNLKKKMLFKERKAIKKKSKRFEQRVKDWFELAENAFNFACYARYKFNHGNLETKRIILKGLGSNLILKDQKLEIYPIKLFSILREPAKKSDWGG